MVSAPGPSPLEAPPCRLVARSPADGQAGSPGGSAGSLGPVTNGAERTRWKIRSDRTVDENPQIRLSVASLELADGTVFDQYVMRLPRCAMTVVLDEAAEKVLLIWRHRFIIDRWLWELPGGYIDPGEEGIAAAAREVEEETGYRPRSIEHVLTFQPMAGSADSAHEVYLAHGADSVGAPLADEAEEVRWMPLAELPALIATGKIVGAATIIGAQHALLTARHPTR
jgi:8-oxo-dGTP pyrophosphatase MutT (NUDIX family)